MKKSIYFVLSSFLLLVSCEEVVELDLNQHEKKLVIDANLFVDEMQYSKIRVFYSAPFYVDTYQYVSTATVTITDLASNETYPFVYSDNGFYENTNFTAQLSHEYELNISYDGAVYKAYSQVWEAPEILNVEQINDGGFSGDSYEIRFYYQDPADTDDYYLMQTTDSEENEFSITNDQFTNGNLVNDIYFADKEQVGETIFYALAKIDKNYYNYLNKMFSNAAEAGNPFATPTGTVKGNIENSTMPNNFPLGYFHISKRSQTTYTIQ